MHKCYSLDMDLFDMDSRLKYVPIPPFIRKVHKGTEHLSWIVYSMTDHIGCSLIILSIGLQAVYKCHFNLPT